MTKRYLLVFYLLFLLVPGILTTITLTTGAAAQNLALQTPRVTGQNYSQIKNVSLQHNKNISRVNRGTVGIIAGDIGGTYMRIAADLAAVLDSNRKPKLRLLPISGRGGKANIEDLLFLRGVDLAIVQSDILDYMERERKYRNIRNRVKYIIKLFDSELHIITNSKINDITDLEGKKVNFRYRGSSSELTGQSILKSFNVSVIPTYFDQSLALEMVKRGELSASIVLAGKPSSAYSLIPPNSGLKLLPVKFTQELAERYLPARFNSQDYPGLVKKGESIPTIATSTVLAVYNWPEDSRRYQKAALLVYNLFTYITDFKKPARHKKWSATSPLAKVPGWQRFKPAQDWIDNSFQFVNNRNASTAIFTIANTSDLNLSRTKLSNAEKKELYGQFTLFLKLTNKGKKISDRELQHLFLRFLAWRNSTQKR
ncbi:MAG: TAXI family TRAP transporter solute-binding subunit [Methyloligellaceae bacterium]